MYRNSLSHGLKVEDCSLQFILKSISSDDVFMGGLARVNVRQSRSCSMSGPHMHLGRWTVREPR
jgi:hypothetical protein